MKRFNDYDAMISEFPDFDMNRDFNLMYVISDHPSLSIDGEQVACMIEVLTCEGGSEETVLEVRATGDSGMCGSLEPAAWILREIARPHALQAVRSVFSGCFDLSTKNCDEPENKIIKNHFYLYCDSKQEAYDLICAIMSPKHNAQFR